MTEHKVVIGDSKNMSFINDKSVNLIVTSPPYPMIQMWDEMFCSQDPKIKDCLDVANVNSAFLRMHAILNKTWAECDRVLSDGGIICINIGDATRTVNGLFQLFSNHTQIINFFVKKGYSVLPDIIWRKPSNSPNKFMGSGMYPAGAYVTYEHEYILVFRKGNKRNFKGKERELRQKSAYFWEERNAWFSDLWEIKGTTQTLPTTSKMRNRNASFPLEIPLRLVNMYSVEGDVVLDPFAGLGTTSIACMITNRNSVGIEIDNDIAKIAFNNLNQDVNDLNRIIKKRIDQHITYILNLSKDKMGKCYTNTPHGFPVKTKQETKIEIAIIEQLIKSGNTFICKYKKYTPES